MVEARALRDGVHLAVQTGFNKIIIEGDNPIVIQALKENIQVSWQFFNIIKDIQSWFSQDMQVTTNHIF